MVLILGIGLTLWMWIAQGERERREELNEFQFEADLVFDSIQQRIQQYVEVMRGAQSLLNTYPTTTPAAFDAYIRSLDLPVHYPGLTNVQVARGNDSGLALKPSTSPDSGEFVVSLPLLRASAVVKASLRIDAALGSIIPDATRNTLRLRLVDTGLVSEPRASVDRLLIDAGNADGELSTILPDHRYTYVTGFTLAGRVWILNFERHVTGPRWLSGPLITLLTGTLAATLLFALLASLYRDRDRAVFAADQATSNLRASEAHYRSVVENVRDVVFQIDHNNRWQYLSPAWRELTGEASDSVIGQDALAWVNPADVGPLREALSRLANAAANPSNDADVLNMRVRLRVPKQGERWIQWHGQRVDVDDGAHWIVTGILADVTDNVVAQQTIEHRAHHDVLTGLPNRAMLQDRAASAITHAQQIGDNVALVFVDLDGFKAINDRLGHQAGDTVLRVIAKRLQQAVRRSDLVARLGGDEFVVLIANGATDVATDRVLEQIRSVFIAAINVEDARVNVRASLGVARFPQDGGTLDALLASADRAMYAQKPTSERVRDAA